MNRAEKEKQIAELKEKIHRSVAIVLCNYRKLTVPAVTELRQSFQKEQCEYRVYKNTLLKLALAGTSLEKLAPYLEGPTGVVFAWENATIAAKIARTFGKEQAGFQIKGGGFDGAVLDAKQMDAVADMPSKEEIRAGFLAILAAPATGLVQVLNAGAQSFVGLLDAKTQEEGKQG